MYLNLFYTLLQETKNEVEGFDTNDGIIVKFPVETINIQFMHKADLSLDADLQKADIDLDLSFSKNIKSKDRNFMSGIKFFYFINIESK
jgi:hypothetical protein